MPALTAFSRTRANPALGGLEVRRQHVAGGDPVLHHLDEAHVGGEERVHLGPIDPRQEEHRVGHLPERGEEPGCEHVAVARHHRDEHPVGAAELVAILEEGPHVLVLDRHQLGEPGIDLEPGPRATPSRGWRARTPRARAGGGRRGGVRCEPSRARQGSRDRLPEGRRKPAAGCRKRLGSASARFHGERLARRPAADDVIFIAKPTRLAPAARRRTLRRAAPRRRRAAARPRHRRATAACGPTRCGRRPGW